MKRGIYYMEFQIYLLDKEKKKTKLFIFLSERMIIT